MGDGVAQVGLRLSVESGQVRLTDLIDPSGNSVTFAQTLTSEQS